MISQGFRVNCYIDLHTASPFQSDVIAYPSIFVTGRGESDSVKVVPVANASPEQCGRVLAAIGNPAATFPGVSVSEHETWFKGDQPWVLGSPERLRVLRDLESRFDTIEADGVTKVGIGAATGCDDVYVVGETADIESD